ncbi:IS3 family transposase [Streptomyces sp. NPDC002677]|uniref:IS3 family transposase n=1 Tax=Streptomyces sp. NPDC002677 TaxID=3154774 RepID=UPI003322E045
MIEANTQPGLSKPTPTECVRGRLFTTRAEANLALFEYAAQSHRIQKRLGHLSPIEFDDKHHADRATTAHPDGDTNRLCPADSDWLPETETNGRDRMG